MLTPYETVLWSSRQHHPEMLWWQWVKLLNTDLERFHCSVYQPQLFFSSPFCLMSNIYVVSMLIFSTSSKSAAIRQALGRKCSLKLSITQSQRPVWLSSSSFRSACQQRWKGRAVAGIVSFFHGGGQQVAGLSDVSGQTDRPHDTSKRRLTVTETPRNFGASTNSYPRLQAAALTQHSQSQG